MLQMFLATATGHLSSNMTSGRESKVTCKRRSVIFVCRLPNRTSDQVSVFHALAIALL